jgi:hypothetical protein
MRQAGRQHRQLAPGVTECPESGGTDIVPNSGKARRPRQRRFGRLQTSAETQQQHDGLGNNVLH